MRARADGRPRVGGGHSGERAGMLANIGGVRRGGKFEAVSACRDSVLDLAGKR
jgi:hypothetical protein